MVHFVVMPFSMWRAAGEILLLYKNEGIIKCAVYVFCMVKERGCLAWARNGSKDKLI